MSLAQVNVIARHLGDIKTPLFKLPYNAYSGSQSWLVNSFNAELLYSQTKSSLGFNALELLQASFCTPLARFDGLFNATGIASGSNAFSPAMVLGQLGFTTDDLSSANIFGITQQANQISNQGNIFNVTYGQAASLLPNAPIFVMVQINSSPPTYLPCIFFAALGNNVVNNTFPLLLFSPQPVGPPTMFWAGPYIPGGLSSTKVLPQQYSFISPNTLAYADNSLHTLSFQTFLPDIDNKINRWLVSDSTPQWRIIHFLPGQQGLNFNVDGYESYITFDDPSINTAMNSAVIQQAGRKGFLFKTGASYKGQNPLIVLLTPDGTGYYTVLVYPQDAASYDVMTNPTFSTDSNGILYAAKGNSGTLASSFGVASGLSLPAGASILPVGLPCFEPCLPWQVA